MVGVVEGILGLKPQVEGIVIEPSIPSEWNEFTMEKNFRGKKLFSTVKNPDGVEHGVKCVTVNGEVLDGPLIAEDVLKAENQIEVILG